MINEETHNYQSDLSLAWKKAEITAKIIGAIAVPTILGFGGWIINDNINRRELDAKYVDIAAKALQLDQLSDPFDQSSVRDWAFKIINKYTDNNTKILDSAKIQLVDWFTFIGGNDSGKPDYRIFLCESNQNNSKAKEIGNYLIKKMTSSYDLDQSGKKEYQVGWIQSDIWTDENRQEYPLITNESIKERITIIANKKTDNYNPKGKYNKRVKNWINAVNARLQNDDDPSTNELTIKEINDDKKTISDPTEIIICLPSS
jgi:hypothetical protein